MCRVELNQQVSNTYHLLTVTQTYCGIRQAELARSRVGFVELCAKILQIMRNDFKDYAHTFLPIMCTLCTPLSALYYTHLAFNIDAATLSRVYHKHVTFICAVCHQLGRGVTVRLVIAFVLARLDYCNVILAGLLMSSPH